jgi:hypothetical protein
MMIGELSKIGTTIIKSIKAKIFDDIDIKEIEDKGCT